MNTLEDRLTSALAARADLVQPEDLRPAAPPAPAVVPLVRRPSTWAVAAAAAAVVVAVVVAPLVVGDDGDGEVRPSAPVTSYPATPSGEGADWRVVRDASVPEADLDGDGTPDPLLLRNRTGEILLDEPWRVEAELSSGGVPSVVITDLGYEVSPFGTADLDGDGGDELLYYNGLDETGHEIGVIDLGPTGLVDLPVATADDGAGLTSSTTESGQIRHHWIRGGEVFSTVSVEGGAVPGTSGGPGGYYEVTLHRWTLADGEVVPEQGSTGCVDAMAPQQVVACDPALLDAARN